MTILPSYEKEQSQDFSDKLANLVFNSSICFPEVPSYRIVEIIEGIKTDYGEMNFF